MKKILAVAGLGAAIVGSLLGAGTANASDDSFLNYVAAKTGYYPANYHDMQTAVAVGHGVCNQIDTYGVPGVKMSVDQGISSGFSGYETGYIVAGAVNELCPWNQGVALAAANRYGGNQDDGGSLV
jgi:hypothetical protein